MSAAALIWLAGLYGVLHATRLGLAWRYLNGMGPVQEPDPEPDPEPVDRLIDPVTMLQPILSGDPDLARQLSTNRKTAPGVRIVWLIDDDDAEAGRVTAHLLAQTKGGATVLSGRPPRDGENPKLLKLIRGTPAGAVGSVVVLDDDTGLAPGGARRLAGAAQAAQGLATAIPVWGRAPAGLAEMLVAGFVDGQGVATYFAMSAMGRNRTINGMAYALRAQDLQALGGFGAAGHEVTDDWAVARLWQGAGLPLVQTAEPAAVAVSVPSLRAAGSLLRRWMLFAQRYMRANLDGAMIALVVMPGLLPLAGLGWALATGPGATAAWLALLLGRAGVNRRLVRAVCVRGGVPDGGRTRLIAVVVADILMPVFAVAAAWRPRLPGGKYGTPRIGAPRSSPSPLPPSTVR